MSTTAQAPEVAALDAVIGELETVDRQIRAAEAERLRLLAAAFDIAAAQNGRRPDGTLPAGADAELAYRSIRAEVATALHQSEYLVERQMSLAHALAFSYPRTQDAYRGGEISGQHATVVVDAGAVIGGGDNADAIMRRAAYEEAVLEYARVETAARLRPIARRLAEQYAEVPLDERHAEARKRRRVYVVDGDDGMSDLIAHLPATLAHAISQRLTTMSVQVDRREAAQRAADAARASAGATGVASPGAAVPGSTFPSSRRERRRRDEIRTDLFTHLLLDTRGARDDRRRHGASDTHRSPEPHGAPDTHGGPEDLLSSWADDAFSDTNTGLEAVRARVQIVIPVRTIADGLPAEELSAHPEFDERGGSAGGARTPDAPTLVETSPPPPHLTGYGPIDTDTARSLAADAAHWETVRIDEATGAILSVERYRPSERIRRFLAARDQHCRFPGCSTPITRCDIDHTIDAQYGGLTATTNLAHLCRRHHTLKHHSAWTVQQRPGGVTEWTSPTGRTHHDRPPGRVTFVPVEPDPPPESAEQRRPPDDAYLPF